MKERVSESSSDHQTYTRTLMSAYMHAHTTYTHKKKPIEMTGTKILAILGANDPHTFAAGLRNTIGLIPQ